MRLTFLGTGTSSGVPVIGCDCAVCTSTDSRDNRLRTSAAIEFTDPLGRPRTVLIDCSPDLRQQALRAKLQRCDAVIFTHNHVDHTFGVDELRRFNAVQKSPIDVFADAHTMDHLRRVYKHIFEREHNVNDSFVASLIPHFIDPETPFDLFGLLFTPIKLLHGRLPVLGFRIEQLPLREGGGRGVGSSDTRTAQEHTSASPLLPLAYCTDVSAIPTESWKLFRGVNTLILDALRHRHHPTHFTVEQAVNAADRIGAQRTFLVHMTHDLPHEETNAHLPEGIELAYDGLVLT